MAVNIETRNVRGPLATEIYISATLENCAAAKDKLLEMFAGIRKILAEERASIIEERIFTVDGALAVVSAARAEAYGEIDDGVAPSVLTGRESRRGHTVGVQVHAVARADKPEVVMIDGRACGRVIRTSGGVYLTLSGIPGGKSGERIGRAIAMFEKAESVLKQYGSDFRAVSRTWMWLGDILSWYGEFNKARNQFFEK
jgi:hypothetical protein